MNQLSRRKNGGNVLLSLCFWAVFLWCLIAGFLLFRYSQEMEQRFALSQQAGTTPPVADHLAASGPVFAHSK